MTDPNAKPADIGAALIIDMVRGMSSLAKTNEVLAQKIEDLTASLDDNRERIESIEELLDESSGYMGAMLRILELVADKGAKADGVVKWEDLNLIIKDLQKEVDGAEEEEEEEIER